MNMNVMRDGTAVNDVRLGRLIQFDERSRKFPVSAILETDKKPRSYTWHCDITLNQSEGVPIWSDSSGCTGHSVAHEIAAKPKVHDLPPDEAHLIYQRAKELDEWEGEMYLGSSVLAAVKAATEQGYYKEYRWAFTLEEVILAVGYHGPVIVGTWWTNNMFYPDKETGKLDINGRDAGGHAYAITGINVKSELFRIHNSWGRGWGIGGDATISFKDFDALRLRDGEVCVPVTRL